VGVPDFGGAFLYARNPTTMCKRARVPTYERENAPFRTRRTNTLKPARSP